MEISCYDGAFIDESQPRSKNLDMLTRLHER